MCITCGCGGKGATIEDLDQSGQHIHAHHHGDHDEHHHEHDYDHHHEHSHEHHHDHGQEHDHTN